MVTEVTFIKRVGRSRSGCLIWIPKDVAEVAKLRPNDFVEIRLRKTGGEEES